MKQIARAIRFLGDNLKSYIIVGFIVVLVPSFVLGQDFPQKPDNENKLTEEVVPKVTPPRAAGGLPYGSIFMLNKSVACNDTPVIKNYIQNINGMVPVTMGTNKNRMGAILTIIQLYANPVTATFAIVEHFAISKSCILFQGHNFDIILPERYHPSNPSPGRGQERQAYKLRYM
jgi:hypothetical protein